MRTLLNDTNRFKKKYLNKIIILFCYVIVVYVLVRYFWTIDWHKLIDIDIDLKIFSMAVLTILSLRFFYPTVWVFILKEFGNEYLPDGLSV